MLESSNSSGDGKKKVTINDIARKANVSKSTVSRVLNDTTPVNESKREAVLEAMKAMNFQPNVFARSLAGGKSKTIGVLTQNIGSPFYDAISQGVLEYLSETSYSPIFADGQWETQAGHAAVETLVGRKVDGLILVGGRNSKDDFISLIQDIPTISVGRISNGPDDKCINLNNEQAAYEIVKHLIDLGHRNIAHIMGIKEHPDSISRVEGYRRALTEANVTVDEDLILEGNFDGNSGVIGVESLLMRGKSFSAVFAANDMTAFGARLALYRRGIRVPEDVSLVGFDDQPESAYMTPPLTTVRQPSREMGVVAAEAIVKMINNEPCEIEELPFEVIIRESSRRRS